MLHAKQEAEKANETAEPISLAQGIPPLLEASVSQATQQQAAGQNPTDLRLNKVYGSRGSYIANTLLTDTEYLHYFCIWIVVFAAIIFSLHKLMK
mmetsp:Transcript_951/g.1307  ORF Transcript_951/g.1307 Transcript_951/m.1307 type:complete len:95 (-) Transcript_951:231-515(-)